MDGIGIIHKQIVFEAINVDGGELENMCIHIRRESKVDILGTPACEVQIEEENPSERSKKLEASNITETKRDTVQRRILKMLNAGKSLGSLSSLRKICHFIYFSYSSVPLLKMVSVKKNRHHIAID